MSDYRVPYTTILDIQPHPGADRLEIATVYGFQVVVQKDKYKVGDGVVYVPVDSILPKKLEDEIFPEGSKVKLHKSRVRQIRLRGYASQGILLGSEVVGNFPAEPEMDLQHFLRITKYEPPEPGPSFTVAGDKQRNRRIDNPLFHKYNGLSNIKWFPTLFEEGEHVVMQEKLHGCVQSTTKIRLADGTNKTIKEIVDNKLPVRVMGMDNFGNTVETKILNWFNNGKTNKWLRVKTTREKAGAGKNVSALTCTENHKFFDVESEEYVRADSLKIGSKVYLLHEDFDLSFLQKEILIGKMLGDASLSGDNKNYLAFNQSKKQESYLDYTLEMLGNIAGNKTVEALSGYGTTMCRARTVCREEINQMFSPWFKENKKEIPVGIQLSPISLAYWYMDDGSLAHTTEQEDRAAFATCGFSLESCNNLVVSMKNLGIEAKLKTYSGYNRIFLNADNADKLFVMIAPYIHESMQYKLPVYYRQDNFYFRPPKNKYKSELTVQTVIEIKQDYSHSYDRYDIETETHNYFANNILTHNSNARAGLMPFNANTLFKKILKFLRLAPKYERCYGSNNVEKSAGGKSNHYYGEDIYGQVFKKIDAFSKLKGGESIYGEIIGPAIQKNYEYGLKEHRFLLFDVKLLLPDGKQRWLSPFEVEAFALERGFDMVPILYKGPYNKELAYSLTKGPSAFDPNTKVREGIVIKAAENYSVEGNKKALKWVSEDYLDDKNNTDFH